MDKPTTTIDDAAVLKYAEDLIASAQAAIAENQAILNKWLPVKTSLSGEPQTHPAKTNAVPKKAQQPAENPRSAAQRARWEKARTQQTSAVS